MSRPCTAPIQYGPNGCEVNVDGRQTCRETQTLEIIKEFNRVYESKMQELGRIGGGDNLVAKVHLQQDWIRDLTQQNEMLVRAVEELEKEASDRVSLLEERLESSAKVMQKYKDNCSVYLNETFQKMDYLQNDVCNLVEFIKRVRDNRQWSIEGLKFYTINASCLLRACSCFCDCPTSLVQSIPVQEKSTPPLQNKETAVQDVQKLDTKLLEMERRLSQSPKDTDMQELNFKLHLKDEELTSVKRSSMAVRDSLLIEVAEKHDDILSLSRDLQTLKGQCLQAKEDVKRKDNYIMELAEQIMLSKEKSLGKDFDSGRQVKSSNKKRLNLEKDDPNKNLDVEVNTLDKRCQEECQSSFVKDIIITDLKKEIRLLKDRITKLEETKSSQTPATQQSLTQRSRPSSLSPRSPVPKEKHTIKSQKCLFPNPTSICLCSKQIQSKRPESPPIFSPRRSCSPQCFCLRPNCGRQREMLQDEVKTSSKKKLPKRSKSSSPLGSLLDIVEYANAEPFKSGFSPKKKGISLETSKVKSLNSPWVYLYESDVKRSNTKPLNATYIHKKSEENVSLTIDDCYYSSNANSDASLKNVRKRGCTLSANKILHEYYGISDFSGSHGVIKNFQEVTKVNLVNVPKRIPIKTYINNLELNIKKSAQACVGIRKTTQPPNVPKNKKLSLI